MSDLILLHIIYTVISAPPTVYFALPTVHSAPHTVHFAPPTVHFAPPSVHFAPPMVHFAPTTVHWTEPLNELTFDEHPEEVWEVEVSEGDVGDAVGRRQHLHRVRHAQLLTQEKLFFYSALTECNHKYVVWPITLEFDNFFSRGYGRIQD